MDKQLYATIESADSDPSQTQGTTSVSQPRLLSTALFGTTREIVIAHQGAEYRLCITRNEKLILIK